MMDSSIAVFSVKEVAAILKTSCQQVRKMIQNEELPAVKVGREWRITVTAIEELISDQFE